MNTKVVLCGETLDNPIIPASGTFGYGKEFAELYDINVLGTFSFKGTTEQPRFGNPTPRIAECASGMINCVGLQNPGADEVIRKELPEIRKFFKKKVMANVCGFSVGEYVRVAEKFDKCPEVGWLEINVSCPNVHGGGMSFGTTVMGCEEVVSEVRRKVKKPIIVKLSPNVTDITEIARAAEASGADGVSLINTLVGMRLDIKKRKPLLSNVTGGVSGRCVFPVALAMVYKTYRAVKIPVVGTGGISCAEDVIEMMLAGATAVEIGSENLVNPYACRDIIEELPKVMEKYGIDDLSEIIGRA